MSVKLTTRRVGEVTIIDAAGRITLGEGSSALRHALREQIDRQQRRILLNLGAVTHIDSAGIGELVTGFTQVTRSGGQLKLLGPTKLVRDLLRIVKVDSLFEVFDEEATAVRSFP